MPSSTSTRERSVSRLAVTADPSGRRSRVRLGTSAPPTAPLLRPWLHTADDRGARVSLVPEGALLLAGDHVRVEVVVGPGAWLEVVEPSGTVAYPSPTPTVADWEVDVVLGAGASLRWLGRPFVVAEGACVRRSTRVRLGEGSRLVLRETLVLGRSGEGPGTLRSELRVDAADRPLLAEDLDLGPSAPPVLLGGARVLDSVLLVGAPAPGTALEHRLDLDAGGHLWRSLGPHVHSSGLDEVVAGLPQRTG